MFVNIKDSHKAFVQHTLLVIFFAIMYYFAHLYIIRTSNKVGLEHPNRHHTDDKLVSFFDCIRFSLITQTTVGYGSLIPKHPITETINIIQLMTIYGVIILSFV